MNDLDTPTGERAYKRHATLKAQAAILGFELIKSDPEICGQAPYYLYRHADKKRHVAVKQVSWLRALKPIRRNVTGGGF
jgi:hypothetical protein